MAHELSAAGFGFLWPQIAFACDGESMQIWSVSTRPDSPQPVKYLSDGHDTIPIEQFVDAASSFIDLVVNRFDELGIRGSDLQQLWEEVREEQLDPKLSEYRKVEAILGFDPDEVDSPIVDSFLSFGEVIGTSALGEIASACASLDPARDLARIKHAADLNGLCGRFALPRIETQKSSAERQRPWVRGQELAHALRSAMGERTKPISDEDLSSLLELGVDMAIESAPPSADRLPVGVGIRNENDAVKLVLRKRNRPGRRFELSRLICDHLLSDPTDHWLPVTDTKLIRQKWQRSFAAEFLCPITALAERLDEDYSEDSIEDAAEYFGVSDKTVSSQLVNHRLLPPSVLESERNIGAFPYLLS
jgi:hypothetical protein